MSYPPPPDQPYNPYSDPNNPQPSNPSTGVPPGYGAQPPYGAPPNYGAQPPYGAPPNYGAQQPYGAPQGYPQGPYPGYAPAAPQSNGLATASLILGILGILFGFVAGIPAIITGHMALGRIKENPALESSRGQAMAGLIMGYIFSGIALLCTIGFIALIVASPSIINSLPTPTPFGS